MSVNSFNTAISIPIKPSFQKLLLVIVPHVFALIVVFTIAKNLAIGLTIVLVFFISISVIYYSQLHLFLSKKNSVTEVRQDSAKNWLIKCNNSETDEFMMVDLLGSSFSSSIFIVLNFLEQSGKYYSVVFTSDSLTGDQFRYLKIRLKLIK